MDDDLFAVKMHFEGPDGYGPCTRPWPHGGPCAHPELKHFDGPDKDCYQYGCTIDCPVAMKHRQRLN